MTNGYIIDFGDSFTFNIKEIFYKAGFELEVVNWDDVVKWKVDFKKDKLIVWGPGPGHPEEYKEINPILEKCLENDFVYNFGICLGHQLIGLNLGLEIGPCKDPIHGRSLNIEIPRNGIFHDFIEGSKQDIQFYNSLTLVNSTGFSKNIWEINGEIWSVNDEKILTYQFHPESVGTSFRESFFYKPLEFLYNSKDETV